MKPLRLPLLLAAGLSACVDEPTRVPAHSRAPTSHTVAGLSGCPARGDVLLTNLGTLPGGERFGSFAADINEHGQVVGNSTVPTSDPTSFTGHAFRWTAVDGMRDLGTLRGGDFSASAANAVDDHGRVVGESDSPTRAFLWTEAGGMRGLGGVLSRRFSTAEGISNRGHIVGQHKRGVAGATPQAYLRRPGGEVLDLGTLADGLVSVAAGVNNHEVVVGTSDTEPFERGRVRAFIWTAADGLRDLGVIDRDCHGCFSRARAVNDRGQVVGESEIFGGDTRAFLWTAANGMRDLGTLPGARATAAYDINERGQVVGASGSGSFSDEHAFLWTAASGMRDLGTLFRGGASRATGINERGQIVGTSVDPTTDVTTFRATLWTLIDDRPNYQTILALAAEVQSLVPDGKLTPARARTLVLGLERSLAELDQRHPRVAADILRDFVSRVEALISARQLSRAHGQPLIDLANCVFARLS